MSDLPAWEGILPIVSVPFLEDGRVDYASFMKTLEYIDQTEAFGMVLFGIASEFYKLSDVEKDCLVRIYASFPTSKKKVASVTDHAKYLAVERAKYYQELGLDGLMLLPPFFLSPGKEAVFAHVRAILHAVQLPVILQVAPKETGLEYRSSELFALYQQFPQLIFKIEASPLPKLAIQELLHQSDGIRVFNGYAGKHMLEALGIGCSGIMPGCSFIEVYTHIYTNYLLDSASVLEQFQKLQKYLAKWMSGCEYIIAAEKYILYRKKIITTSFCRAPSFTLQAADLTDIEEFHSEFCIF